MPAARLGYTPEELHSSPYARFFNPHMATLPPHVLDALAKGPVAHELLRPVEDAARLQDEGYDLIENGYTLTADGAGRIACRTDMPGVTPAMWDWWFSWHGSEAQRYKLWHPLAHVDVRWADGEGNLCHYIGRTSLVTEYLGSACLNVSISFVTPSSLGFDEQKLAARGEVAICARCRITALPMDVAWLVHHIRPVAGGAEMRSRFWMGGRNVNPVGMPGTVGKTIGLLAAQTQRYTRAQAIDMLIHDAQEMNHLAAILPELHATFAGSR